MLHLAILLAVHSAAQAHSPMSLVAWIGLPAAVIFIAWCVVTRRSSSFFRLNDDNQPASDSQTS